MTSTERIQRGIKRLLANGFVHRLQTKVSDVLDLPQLFAGIKSPKDIKQFLEHLDRPEWYIHDLYEERQILQHLLHPSPSFNLWDLYTCFLTDPGLDSFPLSFRENDYVLEGKKGNLEYTISYSRWDGQVYYWVITCSWPHTAPVQRLIGSSAGLRSFLHSAFWWSGIDQVCRQIRQHPLGLQTHLLEQNMAIEEWLEFSDPHCLLELPQSVLSFF